MKYSQYKTLRNILLEFFGTMAIVYFANWANQLYELKIIKLHSLAAVYGMIVSLMVYVAQDRSGAHFDPAVTGPIGIPTPQEEFLQTAFIMETLAIVVIHIVRISLLIDNRGKKDSNGFALGAIYTAMVLACAPITGACFSPARSIGPLFVMDESATNGQFIMVLAPFLGCTIAMAIYKQFLISEELEDELEEL